MLSFNQFLIEGRRNPHLNPKHSIVKVLSKFNQYGYFATFIEDASEFKMSTKREDIKNTRSDSPQVTFNTHSNFNTPNGIYTYPIEVMYEEYLPKSSDRFDVPFGANRPFVGVLKLKGNKHLHLESYTKQDLTKDVNLLRKDVIEDLKKLNKNYDAITITEFFNLVKTFATKNAGFKTPGGVIWNITRMICILYSTKNLYDIFKQKSNGAYTIKKDILEDYVPSTNLWATIFRRRKGKNFFYDSVIDYTGKGIIHVAEPFQAVFFSREGYDAIDAYHNKTYEKISDEDLKHKMIVDRIRNGKVVDDVDDNIILQVLFQNPRLLSKIDQNRLTEEFLNKLIDYRQDEVYQFNFVLDNIPVDKLTPKLQIKVLQRQIHYIMDIQNPSKEAFDYVIEHDPFYIAIALMSNDQLISQKNKKYVLSKLFQRVKEIMMSKEKKYIDYFNDNFPILHHLIQSANKKEHSFFTDEQTKIIDELFKEKMKANPYI